MIKRYSIYKDKKKNLFRCKIVADGKIFYVSGKSKPECAMNALDKERELRNHVICDGVTVAEFSKIWMEQRCSNLSPTSLTEWNRLIDKWIVPALGRIEISKLKNADCQALLTEYNKNHSSKSCSALRGVLHNMLEYAVVNDLILRNPADHILIAKTQPYEYYIYSTEEMNRLLKETEGTKHFLPILLASRCGFRMSEICGLRWSDIDLKNGVIKISQVCVNGGDKGTTPTLKQVPKTAHSGRPIIIPTSVLSFLRELKKRLEMEEKLHELVFCHDDGSPFLGRNYGKEFNDLLKRKHLPHTRFHDLRHFVATSLMDAGLPDKEISEYMRHSDTNITKHYEHIRADRKKNAAETMDAIMA